MNKKRGKYLCCGLSGGALLLLLGLILKMVLFLDSEGSAFPHWDEWRFQNDKSFVQTIFSLNNENFQVFTNALYWLAPRIDFPFWGLRYVSLLLLLAAMFALYQLLKKNVADNRRWLLILAFCPCLSAYMGGNLLWTNLTQTWIYFLFTFLGIYFGFEQPQTPKNQFITLILMTGAFLAMNISLPLLFAVLYGVRACYLKREMSRRCFYGQMMVAVLILIEAILLYGIIREHHDAVFSFKTLFSADYGLWLSYALCGVWSGFLAEAEKAWFYYLGGGVMAVWLAFLLYRQIRQPERQGIWAAALILLGGIAMIALYRGKFMLAINDHAVRHIIYGVFLIPIIYTLGASDKHKIVRIIADLWLIVVLVCSIPSLTRVQTNQISFTDSGDACLMGYLGVKEYPEAFTCGRYFADVREPYRYFITHDAAFKNAYQNGHVRVGFIPYHFEGKVFYKIPGKKVLLFR